MERELPCCASSEIERPSAPGWIDWMPERALARRAHQIPRCAGYTFFYRILRTENVRNCLLVNKRNLCARGGALRE
jgi:hypothetical protein